MTAARVVVGVVMSLLLVKAFLLPGERAAELILILYVAVLIPLILKREFAKYIFIGFSTLCMLDFIVFRVQRTWLILALTGLLISYELLEFFFRHNVVVGDEEEHQALIWSHLTHLVILTVVILGASFGTLALFERVAFTFSENFYANTLAFSLIFFLMLYILRRISE